MASIINAATSGGLISTADTSGILQLQTAGTAAVTVDASQNVGVGTASPAAKLVVGSGNTLLGHNTLDNYGGNVDIRSAYQVRAANTPTQLFVASSAGSQTIDTGGAIDLGGYTDSLSRAYTHARIQGLANAGSGYGGYLSLMVTNAGGSVVERARIPTTGGIQSVGSISVGNATPTTSGAGITFPADQSILGASTNANTLDDYEEGTFDVTVTMGTSGTCTMDSTLNKMKYTKIGRVVTIQGQVLVSSVSSPVGDMRMSLPFTNAALDEGTSLSGCVPRFYNVLKPATGLYPYVFVNSSNTYMEMQWVIDNGQTINHIPAAGNYYIINFSYCV